MNDESKKDGKNKDLTGILELSALMPPQSAEELLREDPFAVNVLPDPEQVSDFESIDQLGMTDHPPPLDDSSFIDPFLEIPTVPEEMRARPSPEDLTSQEAPLEGAPLDSISVEIDSPTSIVPPYEEPAPALEPNFSEMKEYSERALESTFTGQVTVPYHLWMSGKFDPFARDKLLLFTTENPIGLSSADLDLQIDAGRVFFPRISEFAGIKLIQELRDSGLSFKFVPVKRDADEMVPQTEGLRLEYAPASLTDADSGLLVIPGDAINPKVWEIFDSIQLVQFLKAEIVEVERSDLFQELLERMIVSLKSKARLKGASALGNLHHELKPLRLPSHYQVEVKASLLKKL